LAEVFVVENASEEVGGNSASVECAVDDEGFFAAHKVVEVVAGGLAPKGVGLLSINVVDERLSGVDRVRVGEVLAESMVEQLDEFPEQAHRDVAAGTPTGSVAANGRPGFDLVLAED
jgi:hypothetical protein